MKELRNIVSVIPALILVSCQNSTTPDNENIIRATPRINYALKKVLPHDTNSFTEGLFLYDGKLFESTGSPEDLPQTKSVFGILDTSSGRIETKAILDKKLFFGEGITILKDKIYQLTYQSNVGFVYDSKTFRKIKEFKFRNKEGWGLTNDSKCLIISDGSEKLTFLSPDNFSIQKEISVFDLNGKVDNLNELEFIEGFIYANVFMTSNIVKINPGSGQIVGQLDLSSLSFDAKTIYRGSMEMNGIAYDSISKDLYVTGKLWPTMYRIGFTP